MCAAFIAHDNAASVIDATAPDLDGGISMSRLPDGSTIMFRHTSRGMKNEHAGLPDRGFSVTKGHKFLHPERAGNDPNTGRVQ